MADKLKGNSEAVEVVEQEAGLPVCGIIMPIADTTGYPENHWKDVLHILSECAESAGFHPNIVSFDDDVGIIQKRIIQNIYSNPIVICDISSRNANVMFELGMRLAFDKPTIIVKDDLTPYSFDISSIEHLSYPSDLRYQTINNFKKQLIEKISNTVEKSRSDPNFSTFLRSYGSFEVVDIKEVKVPESKYLLSQMTELNRLLQRMAFSSITMPPINLDSDLKTKIYKVKLNNGITQQSEVKSHLESQLSNHAIQLESIHFFEGFAELALSSSPKISLPSESWVQHIVDRI